MDTALFPSFASLQCLRTVLCVCAIWSVGCATVTQEDPPSHLLPGAGSGGASASENLGGSSPVLPTGGGTGGTSPPLSVGGASGSGGQSPVVSGGQGGAGGSAPPPNDD